MTLSENKRIKYTIKNDMYSYILDVVQFNDVHVSSKFEFWVNQKFHLVHIGSSEFSFVECYETILLRLLTAMSIDYLRAIACKP